MIYKFSFPQDTQINTFYNLQAQLTTKS